MKVLIGFFVSVVILLTSVVAFSNPADAQDECIVDIQGLVAVTICGGEVVDQLPLPKVTVTESVTDVVKEIVRVPGPTVTLPPVTLPPQPQPTSTVTAPARPAETRTIRQPGPTSTITEEGRRERSRERERGATETVTQTVAPDTTDEEQERERNRNGITIPEINVNTPEAVGIGLLGLAVAVGVVILALWGGYVMGYKAAEKEDTTFMRELLNIGRRGEHS